MQTRSLVISLAALAAACGSLVVVWRPFHHDSSKTLVGSGHAVVSARSVASFSGIKLEGVANVRVVVGRRTAVTVRGDDNIVKIVDTSVSGGTLIITEHNRSFTSKVPLTVTVATPALDTSTLAGAGAMRVDRIQSTSFTATLAGIGSLELSGRTQRLALTVGGTGTADAAALTADAVQVLVAGTGAAHVRATRSLDATIDGTGTIFYSGGARVVRTHVSGTGSIVKS